MTGAGKPLAGKTALVTGGSRGTGRAFALELAELGADVAITARSVTEGDSVLPGTIGATKAAVEALGVRSIAIAADLTNPDDVERVADEVLAAFGRCDILINNAADTSNNVFASFWETTPKSWNAQIQVNLNAMYGLMWRLAPSMRDNGGGFIVNLGSMKEPPGMLIPADLGGGLVLGATYPTSKVAIFAMSSFVASQLAEHNIVVTCINPGGAASEAHYHHMERLGIEPTPTPLAMPVKTVSYMLTCDDPIDEFAAKYIDSVEFAQEKGLATLDD